jgi:prephenate dehydratase
MSALTIAYLGSSGSYSEAAAEAYAARVERIPALTGAPSPADALRLLREGAVERAVLPVANTNGGLVRATLEALALAPIQVVDEIELAVRLSLWGLEGTTLTSLERVASHPQALRQCARNLERLVPRCARLEWSDSGGAARALAAGELGTRTAVLASETAGRRHGLELLASDVHDRPDNRTFFAVLGRAPAASIPG